MNSQARAPEPLPHEEEPLLVKSMVKETPSWLGCFAAGEKESVAACVRQLSLPSNVRSFWEIACDYAIIIAMASACVRFFSPWLYPVAIIVIGARQHALLVLMHDAAHYRLFTSHRWNDWLSNLLCAWPFFATTDIYRHSHLAHHNFLNTDRDPDWMFKRGREDWVFPKSKPELVKLLLGELLGRGLVENGRRLIRVNDSRKRKVKSRTQALARLIYYSILGGVLTITGGWGFYLCFWIVPFATFLPFALRVRSIAEHFGLSWKTIFSSSRHVNPGWLERFILAPHHVSCHMAHHLFPSVPFFNLGRLHETLMSVPSYSHNLHQNDGYFFGQKSVARDLLQAAARESV